MTIKERAIAYRKEAEQSICKSLEDMSTMEIEYAYAHGATDQQTIDIDKAIDWLKRELADPMPEELYKQWCEEKLADFRKVMTEQVSPN